MTIRSNDVAITPDTKGTERSNLARWRHERGAAFLIVLSLAVILTVTWILYHRPAHPYRVDAYSATWTKDVKLAISERNPVGPIKPSGPLRNLPGVGRIVSVIVERSNSGKEVVVLFLTGDGLNEAGLVYLNGYPPPQDTCNVHLGGPWWQVGPLNTTSMSCARGFHFTGGG
jgi:hypothetical protein